MSPEEFKDAALNRGYASLGTILLWMKQNPKEEYTDDDLLEVYRFEDRRLWRDQMDDQNRERKRERLDEEERKQRMRDSWL